MVNHEPPEAAPLTFRVRAHWARLLRATKTCRTARVARADGVVLYERERPWTMERRIVLGNCYLYAGRAELRFLPLHEWRAWERQAHQVVNGIEVEEVPRGLRVHAIDGKSLAAILANPDTAPDESVAAAALAATAMRRAHQVVVQWPDGRSRSFSHADATAGNVICDLACARASWIDFETCHLANVPVRNRRADDLRALLLSAVDCAPPRVWCALTRAITQAYEDAAVIETLVAMLNSPRMNGYQMAQAALPPSAIAKVRGWISDRTGG